MLIQLLLNLLALPSLLLFKYVLNDSVFDQEWNQFIDKIVVQIIRIKVESKSSAWEKCDLRHTRIKDTKRGQILLFKELRWQTLRIEAQSVIEKDLPPLRLLTLEAVCRLTIKKRLSGTN